ncbi:Glycosyltransferase sugar-binding region containing DXD motif-containing protein [Prevotella sp. tc2-28]|uniref:glycosyltransferase family 32 protein n=1 Tax=Prevotella sp. tc2-28 TaxID=1761888 RepID=UPI00089D874C|nr:glycosyltransferase [Prevotella sp. tc2-28]SEA51751.1 Glycosyltransferase sugar-binding region containing DXD motif-containing protein [Prevotella sp. tc2-28]
MAPKIIHYCWFGGNPLPESAKKCIASWREYLPDYEIWQWSEGSLHDNVNDNENVLFDKILSFDVNSIPYTQQAYEAKKYAFVSDYARFWVLYHYGGLYFDTDVEVIKPFDDIVARGAFMGLEIDGLKKGTKIAINPGLGLGAEAELPIYQEILNGFTRMAYYGADGKRSNYTMIPMVTDLFLGKGLEANGKVQSICDVTIYPQRFFNPYNGVTGELSITSDTHSIHWYSATWMETKSKWIVKLKRTIRSIIRL